VKRFLILFADALPAAQSTADEEAARFINGVAIVRFMEATVVAPTDRCESDGKLVMIASKVSSWEELNAA